MNSEWISVTDSLPDAAGDYLACCDEHGDGSLVVISTAQYEGDGVWTPDYNPMLPGSIVTHWMRLPEPPRY